jgi:hypothetical protein
VKLIKVYDGHTQHDNRMHFNIPAGYSLSKLAASELGYRKTEIKIKSKI